MGCVRSEEGLGIKEVSLVAGCLVIGLVCLSGCPPPPAVGPVTYGESLRILTFNVRMIPETWDDFCCDYPNDVRATYLAQHIRDGDYDVVVLCEVFDEDSREAFVTELSGKFPNYVEKVEDGAMEDSGLMLFSRYPFQYLPHHVYEECSVDAFKNGTEWTEVASILYDACDSWDCDSDKAVALVRIKNPGSGRVVTIVFTHTQASYGDGDCTVRPRWTPARRNWGTWKTLSSTPWVFSSSTRKMSSCWAISTLTATNWTGRTGTTVTQATGQVGPAPQTTSGSGFSGSTPKGPSSPTSLKTHGCLSRPPTPASTPLIGV